MPHITLSHLEMTALATWLADHVLLGAQRPKTIAPDRWQGFLSAEVDELHAEELGTLADEIGQGVFDALCIVNMAYLDYRMGDQDPRD